jgi:glycerophosphoryl diester phosphodiesterase
LPVYAHRLGGSYGPESSPASLEHTLSQPVDGMEADVVLSADEQVVVLHDPGLSFSTNLDGWAET